MIPVILCGGVGSRLWPASRDGHPKPFMRLADGSSLLQRTFRRAARIPGAREAIAVAHEDLLFHLQDDFLAAGAGVMALSCLLEPARRGTAPAVAAAALHAARKWGEDRVLLVLPADHLVRNDDAWLASVEEARAVAERGRIAVFGVVPGRAETGYGYIEAKGGDVARFVEKPSAEDAASYIAQGFLWNAGMACATAGALLREMAAHCPGVLEGVRKSLASAPASPWKDPERILLAQVPFESVPDISFDVAVLEKARGLAVIRCDPSLGWSDAGTWSELGKLVPPDARGNRFEGDVLLVDSRDCQVRSDGRVVAALGVSNLLVIDTPDALLVADRAREGDVKAVHAQLKSRGHESASTHRKVHRPWGVYTVLVEGPRYKVKHLAVKPGAALSLQAHAKRSEHWVVVQGIARVEKDGEVREVAAGESAAIPAGCRHRLSNPGGGELLMIEVQTGSHVGEDDIVRFSDDYGRR